MVERAERAYSDQAEELRRSVAEPPPGFQELVILGLGWNRSRVKTRAYAELAIAHAELDRAMDEVKTLRGMLPICSNCKNIRDEQGLWSRIESYITEHSDAEFSHGLCPDCTRELYPDYVDELGLG